jgi:exonuclease III
MREQCFGRSVAVVSFLFWNLCRKPLEEKVASLACRHNIDVVLLAECDVASKVILRCLNSNPGKPYAATFTALDGIGVFSRFAEPEMRTLEEDPYTRSSFQRLLLPSGVDVLVVLVHFPSKLYWSDDSQSQACTDLARQIREWEARLGHSRTVLVGDLNMNPFESGVVSSHGLHGVMARDVARRGKRTVRGRECSFFYNPMWGHFGDALDTPPGTYYDARGEPVTYFWNMFDQVLIRPALLDAFRNESLSILTSDGTDLLVTGHMLPDRSAASDHLPISFSLDI